ncbi:FMN-dependent NADH-azoreductase [Oleiagrimonas sp. MCCC 1A03011]|jgi:FMN-dependent NADH-azoreductase|uniref:FMN-dependent NADH-azoreductase n=1 Tax=Oleiagrimonas sp. MCCC 1A03011 TaxID=1926883 RepID=UPI000DC53404|nr:FMN-dependent NADH-azoreductase [Oleiagrimonas sp. MCCC 1A03011]RAP57801.1 FMN-dependent NADH-azoreductase [Oleiagrimonas sp. MCCC 1A03011]
MNILHLDASALGAHSVSRQLTADIVASLRDTHPDANIVYRDLAADPIPHWQPVVDVSREPSSLGEEILDEFLDADIVVMGAPMYNFGITTQLKAWIDRIAVPGKVFRYTENGPEGLAGGKRVIIASSRGGIYSEGPAAAMDFQENYLRGFLGFIGITDIDIVRAEGIAMGPEQKQKALEQARNTIHGLTRRAA